MQFLKIARIWVYHSSSTHHHIKIELRTFLPEQQSLVSMLNFSQSSTHCQLRVRITRAYIVQWSLNCGIKCFDGCLYHIYFAFVSGECVSLCLPKHWLHRSPSLLLLPVQCTQHTIHNTLPILGTEWGTPAWHCSTLHTHTSQRWCKNIYLAEPNVVRKKNLYRSIT